MSRRACVVLSSVVSVFLTSCSSQPQVPPLETVPFVDIERYMGLWYEIASYPTFFNQRCTNTTAEYTLLDDGRVQVVNECRIGDANGRIDRIEGTAQVVNDETNAELKVRFFLFGEGDYWIIDLDEDYQWAVVGDPGRTTLFVLSRTPMLEDEVYQGILESIRDCCYDTGALELTPTDS